VADCDRMEAIQLWKTSGTCTKIYNLKKIECDAPHESEMDPTLVSPRLQQLKADALLGSATNDAFLKITRPLIAFIIVSYHSTSHRLVSFPSY